MEMNEWMNENIIFLKSKFFKAYGGEFLELAL